MRAVRGRSPLGMEIGRVLRFVLREHVVLLTVALSAGSVWAFAELVDELREGEIDAFDRQVLLAVRTEGDLSDPIGPPWVEEMARDLTALGGVAVLTLVSLAVTGFLLLRRKRRTAAVVIVATLGGLVASTLLKAFFGRPRPELVSHESYVVTSSFPSGHSMMAAVVYLTLGAILSQTYRDRRIAAFVLSTSVLLTILVGASRVYLGVHFPTDVLGGWALGAAWALLVSAAARLLRARGRMDTAS